VGYFGILSTIWHLVFLNYFVLRYLVLVTGLIGVYSIASFDFVFRLYLFYSGRIYTITDVEEVHKWMVDQIGQHPLFKRLEKEEEEKDEIVPLLYDSTEEGQKVTRNSGQKWLALFLRLENP